MNGFADKRLLELTDYHKIILKIWFIEDPELHQDVEKFYLSVEPYLDQIKVIAVNPKDQETEIILVSNKPRDIERRVAIIKKEKAKTEKKISVRVFSEEETRRLVNQKKAPFSLISDLSIIYDPDKILLQFKQQTKEVIK
jgi:hypothetical protein